MIRKTTKEILTDSFIELAQHKPVNKITVADVTSNCGMAAPTFYHGIVHGQGVGIVDVRKDGQAVLSKNILRA